MRARREKEGNLMKSVPGTPESLEENQVRSISSVGKQR